MEQKNLALVAGLHKCSLSIVFLLLFSTTFIAQEGRHSPDSTRFFISVETDPAFWAGTISNGFGFDANVDFRLRRFPHLRFGILGYSGKWSGSLGKSILLTKDFTENNWETQWNGLGTEVQYQFRFGMKRGGLQPGLRLQWNQFEYFQNNLKMGEANHFVLTPQIGFQWFPFKKIGLYILPWAAVQVPVLGTNKISSNATERATRKMMPIAAAHIGWEFRF